MVQVLRVQAGARLKKAEKANMAGGVEVRLAMQNNMDRMHCVLTCEVLMLSLMTTWSYDSSMAGETGQKSEYSWRG
jgi:hypothetical protein